MARKVIFNTSNTLVATINKINTMSTSYLGDLDDLHGSGYLNPQKSFIGGFKENEYIENGGLADQSAVAALEWLFQEADAIDLAVNGFIPLDSNDSAGARGITNIGAIKMNKVLVADSAVIKSLKVAKLFIPIDSDLDSQSATVLRDSLDSDFYAPSFQGGPIFNTGITIDSGYITRFSGPHMDIGKWFTTDSGFRTFFNDSTDSIGNFVPLFNFGFTVRDSAYIGTLHGPRGVFPFPRPRKPGFPNGYTFDSATLVINGDSAGPGKSGISTINVIAPDSLDSSYALTLDYDSGLFRKITVDSINLPNITFDSTDSAFGISTLFIDVDSSFDSIKDFRPGFPSAPNINIDSAVRTTFHDRLDSGFSFVSPFSISDSNDDIILGGFLISQYDSDNRLV